MHCLAVAVAPCGTDIVIHASLNCQASVTTASKRVTATSVAQSAGTHGLYRSRTSCVMMYTKPLRQDNLGKASEALIFREQKNCLKHLYLCSTDRKKNCLKI